jgi:hypothetical protein
LFQLLGQETESTANKVSEEPQLPDSFLRLAKSWVLPPFLAYLFAIPGLGPGALFVPVVIWLAPLGIISHFQKVSLDVRPEQAPLVLAIHFGFWALLLIGLLGRFRIPLVVLRTIWFILVIALFMTVRGCTGTFGEGLRSPGNWH